MTALWVRSDDTSAGYSHGAVNSDGEGDGWSNDSGWGDGESDNCGSDGWGDGEGDGCGSDNGWSDGWTTINGDGWGRRNGNGYPEQAYDGCTAIGRLLVYEATLPVADLLTLAVTR